MKRAVLKPGRCSADYRAIQKRKTSKGTMNHKSFGLVETKTDEDAGTFEALVSVFGNVDHGGDRIANGAYAKTLERWRESGDPIPIILSHKHDDPMAHIGTADPNEVMEVDKGLLVKGSLDIEDNPVAKQVFKLMKRRSLKEFSIGYRVPKGGQKRGKDGVTDISEIDLIETGPTLKGMNDQTELGAVKSALDEVTEPEQEGRIWLTVNQARHKEGLDPIDGGDNFKVPLQIKTLTSTDDEEPATRSPEGDHGAGQGDPLQKDYDDLMLYLTTSQIDKSTPQPEPEQVEEVPGPEPPSLDELRQKHDDLMLELLTGSE